MEKKLDFDFYNTRSLIVGSGFDKPLEQNMKVIVQRNFTAPENKAGIKRLRLATLNQVTNKKSLTVPGLFAKSSKVARMLKVFLGIDSSQNSEETLRSLGFNNTDLGEITTYINIALGLKNNIATDSVIKELHNTQVKKLDELVCLVIVDNKLREFFKEKYNYDFNDVSQVNFNKGLVNFGMNDTSTNSMISFNQDEFIRGLSQAIDVDEFFLDYVIKNNYKFSQLDLVDKALSAVFLSPD